MILTKGVYETVMTLEGLARLVEHEGEATEHGFHVPYKDSLDNWTIGVGHLLTEEELVKEVIHLRNSQLRWRFGLTNDEAKELLYQDVIKAGKASRVFLEGIPHSQEVKDVITEMAFQLGRTGLFKFKRLRKALKERNFSWAAEEVLDSKLAKADAPSRAREYAARLGREH